MFDSTKYVGIPYDAGRDDCFGLVRRYYQDVWGLWLPNLVRPSNFWEDPLLDITKSYKKMGFEVVVDEDPQLGDGLLMPLYTAMNTHTAVVCGDNQILHHLPGRLSSVDRLRPTWLARTTILLRHPHVTKLRKASIKTIQFHEVSRARVFRDPAYQEAVATVLGDGA